MADLLDAALELAGDGLAVFPVGPDKRPRVQGGFHSASTDPETIRSWNWNGDGMIAAAIPPGTVVIDVDPRNGGTETLKLLGSQGRKLPPTRVVRTGGGGFHYYLTVPEGVSLRGKLGPGVDVKRAGKGYVIVPPSPGYRRVGGFALAEAPAWLLEELAVPEADETAHAASAPKFFPWEKGTAYGLGAMERELGRLATAQEGGRNDALNAAAFSLAQLVAGGELDHDTARDALHEVAERIGLEPDEIEKTSASGWSAGEAEPRQAPAKDVTGEQAARGAAGPPGENLAPLSHGPSPAATHDDTEARFWVDWEIDEPPPPFYLHPLLPKNAYVLVYGATEASKSMVWNALGAEASHRGIRWSVYSFENPPSTDRERLRRLAPDSRNFRLTNEPCDLNDARQLGALVQRERDWGTDVLLIDTYSHAFNSRSEDGNARAIEFARRIRHVMHEVACSVVLIDHTGYSQEDEPRDASAKRQQVDVGILMKKAGEWRPGQPARFTMKCTKSARFANPFFLTGEIRDVGAGERRGLELNWTGDHPRWERSKA